MNVPGNLLYTKTHEWLRVEGNEAYVGITDFAQSQLGDVVFVEVNTVGEVINKDEAFGTIEAVKTVTDIFMPVNGEVLELNPVAVDAQEKLNKDPYGEGWIVKIKMTDPAQTAELLTPEQYTELTAH
jgi:glycine cleavage system H protein